MQQEPELARRMNSRDPVTIAIAALLNAAVIPYPEPNTGKTFCECVLCDELDGHTDECPVPYLEDWAKRYLDQKDFIS